MLHFMTDFSVYVLQKGPDTVRNEQPVTRIETNMKWIFIYATTKAYYSEDLQMQARSAAMNAHRLVSSYRGVIVLDRIGIESQVMQTCQTFDIPLLVIGKTARPASAVSTKVYERAILPKGTPQFVLGKLAYYAMQQADEAVILGDTPDCHAMRMYAKLLKKTAKHIETAPTALPRLNAPDTDWLKAHGHFYVA